MAININNADKETEQLFANTNAKSDLRFFLNFSCERLKINTTRMSTRCKKMIVKNELQKHENTACSETTDNCIRKYYLKTQISVENNILTFSRQIYEVLNSEGCAEKLLVLTV